MGDDLLKDVGELLDTSHDLGVIRAFLNDLGVSPDEVIAQLDNPSGRQVLSALESFVLDDLDPYAVERYADQLAERGYRGLTDES